MCTCKTEDVRQDKTKYKDPERGRIHTSVVLYGCVPHIGSARASIAGVAAARVVETAAAIATSAVKKCILVAGGSSAGLWMWV